MPCSSSTNPRPDPLPVSRVRCRSMLMKKKVHYNFSVSCSAQMWPFVYFVETNELHLVPCAAAPSACHTLVERRRTAIATRSSRNVETDFMESQESFIRLINLRYLSEKLSNSETQEEKQKQQSTRERKRDKVWRFIFPWAAAVVSSSRASGSCFHLMSSQLQPKVKWGNLKFQTFVLLGLLGKCQPDVNWMTRDCLWQWQT